MFIGDTAGAAEYDDRSAQSVAPPHIAASEYDDKSPHSVANIWTPGTPAGKFLSSTLSCVLCLSRPAPTAEYDDNSRLSVANLRTPAPEFLISRAFVNQSRPSHNKKADEQAASDAHSVDIAEVLSGRREVSTHLFSRPISTFLLK